MASPRGQHSHNGGAAARTPDPGPVEACDTSSRDCVSQPVEACDTSSRDCVSQPVEACDTSSRDCVSQHVEACDTSSRDSVSRHRCSVADDGDHFLLKQM
ncbi:hypothetical protein ACOMHN_019281 [Nucella lapillus]